ncbi:MAG: DUF5655 domain-containing protein [Thermocrispum sp.]
MANRWVCPQCDREFDRPNVAHVCVPGCTVEETFARRPEQLPTYHAVLDCVRELGPVHEDAVRVGVFLKADRKLAELRPKSRWLSLGLALTRRIDHPRIARVLRASSQSHWHVIKLHAVADVDDEVRAWLAEAYHTATHGHGG